MLLSGLVVGVVMLSGSLSGWCNIHATQLRMKPTLPLTSSGHVLPVE